MPDRKPAFPEDCASALVASSCSASKRPTNLDAGPERSAASENASVPLRSLAMLLRALTVTAVVVYFGCAVLQVAGPGAHTSGTTEWVLGAVLLMTAARCLLRAITVPGQRLPWIALAIGLSSWAYGEVLLVTAPSFLAGRNGLSLADMASLAFYPATCAGLMLLLRAAVPRFSALLWLDGLAGALAVSAMVAVEVFRPVLADSGGSFGRVLADMSYPLADLLLIVGVIFSLAMTGWRPGPALGLLTAALLLIAVADGFSLWWTSTGHTTVDTLVGVLWPVGALLIGEAAGRPPITSVSGPPRAGFRSLVFPVVFSTTALALLLLGLVRSLNTAGYELATSALAFLVVRMLLTAARNLQMTAASRQEALTDALTGLGNRRKLMLDLEAATVASDPARPAMLMLFDLDGFKLYNDTFGHPAGDALLSRLGNALRRTVAPFGEVYRLGGDEFCVLCSTPPENVDETVRVTLEALSERGAGFSVGASFGSVLIPTDAADTTLALQLADQRLYIQKGERRRSSDSQQARDVLMQALRERHAGLPEHLGGVALLAQSLARRFALGAEEVDQVTRAAELHDIGKMAIPETILEKPAALDKSELSLIRQHTVIGERILAAAPALRPVGELVRASHEYYDGSGYPDGLEGEAIPLGARIITVCDAFEAMTSGRPYRAAISVADALAELRRCAGTQFDPRVVEAFCREALAHLDRANRSQGAPPAERVER